jgi:hypothetical protein
MVLPLVIRSPRYGFRCDGSMTIYVPQSKSHLQMIQMAFLKGRYRCLFISDELRQNLRHAANSRNVANFEPDNSFMVRPIVSNIPYTVFNKLRESCRRKNILLHKKPSENSLLTISSNFVTFNSIIVCLRRHLDPGSPDFLSVIYIKENRGVRGLIAWRTVRRAKG